MYKRQLADLVGAVAAFAGLAAYCAFQVLHPELQKRKMAAARLRQAKRYGAQIAHHIGVSVGGIIVDGDINAAALDRPQEYRCAAAVARDRGVEQVQDRVSSHRER